jgi:hypothetical protein
MRCDRPVPAGGRLTFVLAIVHLLAAPACVDSDPGALADAGATGARLTPVIDEPASFQFYRFDEGWGPCQVSTPGACQRHIVINRDGLVAGADQGAAFAGRLTAAELDAFVALVIGEAALADLLDDKPCYAGPDYGNSVTIGLAPGLRLVQTTTSCGPGPISDMNAAARAIAERFAGQTSVPPATAPIAPSVAGGRLRFEPELYYLERTWAPAGCAAGAPCQSSMSVGANNDHASLRREGSSRTWLGIDDFTPLAAAAISPEVIATFRDPTSCPDAGGARDHWTIGISPRGLIVEADVAGCQDGPIEQLRAAAGALFDRLSASPEPADAGGDHPPDLRSPAGDGR